MEGVSATKVHFQEKKKIKNAVTSEGGDRQTPIFRGPLWRRGRERIGGEPERKGHCQEGRRGERVFPDRMEAPVLTYHKGGKKERQTRNCAHPTSVRAARRFPEREKKRERNQRKEGKKGKEGRGYKRVCVCKSAM